ncbi:MAG: UDP-N-acetylglucosamine--N-acetylmuramyl-(pentapeptide) pyrophosphoryl-undecaprenol N-acetylglucosamine transferase [Acidimicrobiales bacterium]
MSQRRYAVIAGGGTAGHVFVATAIAGALAKGGLGPEDIELVGSRRGQEAALAAGQGYALTLLAGRGIVRRINPDAIVANLGALAGLAWASARAVVLLARRRPKVVVSVGGYASVPAGLAAALLRVPIVLVNVDATPGAAHRLLGRFAKASAVAFAGTPLPHAVVTGAPVRPGLSSIEHSADRAGLARGALGVPADRTMVAVFGGSLGARRLNDAALELAANYRGRGGLTLFHVTGPRNFEEVCAARAAAGAPGEGEKSGLFYRVVAFEEHMDALYCAADVVVCRAGALTVAELSVAGVAAVLVPLPGAPGDHQSANAAALVDAGAAVLLRDEECDGHRLADCLNALLASPRQLAAMRQAADALGRPDAADAVAALVRAHAG